MRAAGGCFPVSLCSCHSVHEGGEGGRNGGHPLLSGLFLSFDRFDRPLEGKENGDGTVLSYSNSPLSVEQDRWAGRAQPLTLANRLQTLLKAQDRMLPGDFVSKTVWAGKGTALIALDRSVFRIEGP